jgi:putative tricarboxylic transport membrane protein
MSATRTPPWQPTAPVQLVIGRKLGGAQSRWVGELREALLRQGALDVPVELTAVPGGGGTDAFAYADQRRRDAHVLVCHQLSQQMAYLTGDHRFGPHDTTPVAILLVEHAVTTVPAGSPITSVEDLLALLACEPQRRLRVAVGSTAGNASHLSLLLSLRSAGIDPRRIDAVTAEGADQMREAVFAGRADLYVSSAANAIDGLRSGRLRAIAHGAPERPGPLASVPTWRELGLSDGIAMWRGLSAPRDVPTAALAFWDRILGDVADDPQWRNANEELGIQCVHVRSDAAAEFLARRHEELAAALAMLGMTHSG